eukprot:Skav232786  [mRNA]  locus=scaffold614:202164:202508:- [translate_table: standard]
MCTARIMLIPMLMAMRGASASFLCASFRMSSTAFITVTDLRQASCGVWYFHKKGGTYKSGSFKGMDLACGDKEGNVFAGLLLRAVIDPSDKLIEGPCLVVDKILELNGCLDVLI